VIAANKYIKIKKLLINYFILIKDASQENNNHNYMKKIKILRDSYKHKYLTYLIKKIKYLHRYPNPKVNNQRRFINKMLNLIII